MRFEPRPKSIPNLLKMKSGDSIKGIFKGNPYTFRQHWHNGKGILCSGAECPLCKEDHRPSFRFRLNFLVNENGNYVAKVFEQGGKVYDKLEALSADYDLEKTIVKITRQGSDQTTTYDIIPVPDGKVGLDLESKLRNVSLNELGPVKDEEDNEDIPF